MPTATDAQVNNFTGNGHNSTVGTVQPFTFEAEIRQVKSMADHSVNVTLNLPEYADASWFLKRIGALINCAVVEVDGK